MNDNIKQDFESVLNELEETLKQFSDLQEIFNAYKSGKCKLSATKLKKLESEYEQVNIKIEKLNQRAKILKNI